MHRTARLVAVLAFVRIILAQSPAGPAKVVIPMRDGVKLSADVYGATPSVRKPVLLQRTPYNKAGAAATALRFAKEGYVVVVQDTRGRFESEGEFFPYNNEGQDGFDTAEWILQQPWSDGRIGMWGASYVGAVQYQALAEGAPGIVVVCPTATWNSFYRNIYTGGVARLALIGTAAAGLYPPPQEKTVPADWYRTLLSAPLSDLDLAIGWRIPWLRTILTHPKPDGFWKRLDLTAEMEKTPVPAQHVVGYYDFFLRETVANFQRQRKINGQQQLILGPWDHGSIGKTTLGEVNFGPTAELDLAGENLRWFNRLLLHRGASDSAPAVRYFSMGDNTWHTATDWPPPESVQTSFYFRSGGKANTRKGDGRLEVRQPSSPEKADTFRSDPARPVPAWPPAMLKEKFAAFWGPVDQGPNEDREDVLVYDSGPLKQPLRVAGPIEADLWVTHDTPDADWVVKLIDVWPNGFAQNLSVGVQRASFIPDRQLGASTAGKPNRVQVDVGHTAAVIQPGHSLRVEVTGSYFPLFDRNLNTGEGPYSARSVIATQHVHHEPSRESRILLHVLSGERKR